MKTVYTYLQRVPQMPDPLELILLWTRSWARWGWRTQVLTLADAKQHPQFAEYHAKIRSIPTVNPPLYEEACWMRWLALDAVGGGWMSDFDVINLGFREADAPDDELMVHDLTACPCLVNANVIGAKRIVEAILACTPKLDAINTRPHWSDMYFFRDQIAARIWKTEPKTCLEFGMPDWGKSPTVHFSHQSVHQHGLGKRREDVIRELGV